MKGELGAFAEDLRRRAGEEKEEELPLRTWLDLAEAWRIRRALERSGGNRSAAACALGIGRRTLYSKLDKFAHALNGPTPTGSGWRADRSCREAGLQIEIHKRIRRFS